MARHGWCGVVQFSVVRPVINTHCRTPHVSVCVCDIRQPCAIRESGAGPVWEVVRPVYEGDLRS